ncbi:helix-turn-helix domain-containing protein [Paenalcaligenes hominis]|uniref:helix-turn-helix domain-containing protein n=1 Tax=Paenalcaligenes hominis TaxID=643674 RepID=UPI003526B76C
MTINKVSPENIQVRFGARLRYLRLKSGLSQEELADASGLDRTYVGGIERGERNPSLKNIARLAEALKVTPSAFFVCDGEV